MLSKLASKKNCAVLIASLRTSCQNHVDSKSVLFLILNLSLLSLINVKFLQSSCSRQVYYLFSIHALKNPNILETKPKEISAKDQTKATVTITGLIC